MTWSIEVLSAARMDEFINICAEFRAVAGQRHLSFDRDVCRVLGHRCMNEPSFFCQMAVDGTGVVVGCMVGYVTQLLYSTRIIGCEEGVYVREGVRDRAAIGSEMLKRFVRFCMDAGAVDVHAGCISNIDNYAVDQFYTINRFKRIGTIYALRDSGDV